MQFSPNLLKKIYQIKIDLCSYQAIIYHISNNIAINDFSSKFKAEKVEKLVAQVKTFNVLI